MAFATGIWTRAVFAKLELPGGDVRLCDGGILKYAGEVYAERHPVWGAIAELPEVESGIDDLVPGGAIMLAPNPATPLSVLLADAVSGSRIRGWQGEVDPATGIVASARLLADLIVDAPRRVIARGRRLIALETMSRAERLFLANRGNVCSPRFHKSIWPGERGFDNCSDVEVAVAWGTENAPKGTGAGGGGGGGGRSFSESFWGVQH
ncbi:MAG TPA: hypothetical protein PKD99_02240 [Sphingopyxis sp.]|nr:hypothetical protein [Sphingopyxis sp.]HMP43896.1 hypothetical protein [Sphingopyxis sp.]HMQ18063.1 hypothetical protein [Sphingopyxis sp.]